MNKKIKENIQESIRVKELLYSDDGLIEIIEKVSDQIVKSYKKGGKVFICGNGGSAADAQHIVAELTGRFYKDRDALNAEALHTNSSYMTAVANDYSFDEVYARMVKGCCREGDILIGLSTSGNSVNILKAFNVAKEKKVTTIGLTGLTGGKMVEMSDYLIKVPSTNTPRIQEAHILIGHIICELIENEMFED